MNSEFVKQTLRENLTRILVPHVADGLWSIYDNALKACERNSQPEKTLQTFQNLLTRIPQWSDETLNAEVDRITLVSKCDYIEDLLLGVFVSYIRAFASLQQADTNHVNVDFERPSVSKFIHTFYKSAARKSWSQAYLFKTIGVTSEQQARNRRDIETILEATVSEVIDSFIPWRDISRAYFHAKQETPAPPKPVTFEEEQNEVHEFETDNEESDDEEEERPRLQLGEDTKLDEFEDDKASVDTEAELEAKAKENEVVSLNL
jgi:hypothetical protein